MFESRCGVCCNSCQGKEEVTCTWCLYMKKPFLGGDCPVKTCCEKRKLDYCGQCCDFPCNVLSDMGKEEGFDSSIKIAQCKKWAEEEAAATAMNIATMMNMGIF